MAKEVVIKIGVDTGEAKNSISKLEASLASMKAQIKDAEIGSKEFKELSEQIKSTESRVKNLNKSFEGLDTEQLAGEFGKLAGGITASIGAISVLGLSAEEDMNKIIATVGKYMMIAQGVKGAIEAAQAATKLWSVAQATLNAIMTANPIGAIVVAVAALVAGTILLVKWLDKSADSIDENTESYKKLKKSQDDAKKSTDDLNVSLEEMILKRNMTDAEYERLLIARNSNKALEDEQKIHDETMLAMLKESLADEQYKNTQYESDRKKEIKRHNEWVDTNQLLLNEKLLKYDKEQKEEEIKNLEKVKKEETKIYKQIEEVHTELTDKKEENIRKINKLNTESNIQAEYNDALRRRGLENNLKIQAESLAFSFKEKKVLLELFNIQEDMNKFNEKVRKEYKAKESLSAEDQKYLESLKDRMNVMLGHFSNQNEEKIKILSDGEEIEINFEIDKILREERGVELMNEINAAKLSSFDEYYKKRLSILTEALLNESIAEEDQKIVDEEIEKLNNEKLAHEIDIFAQRLAFANEFVNALSDIYSVMYKNQEIADKKELTSLQRKNKSKLDNFKGTETQKLALEKKLAEEEYQLEKKQAERQKEIAKEQFIINKASAAIGVVINTALGISQALSSMPPPASYVMAALTGILGAVQLATVLNSKFDDTSYNIEPPSAGSAGSAGTQQTGAPSMAFGDLNQKSSEIPPVKTYVIGQEVSTQQALDRQAQKNGTRI